MGDFNSHSSLWGCSSTNVKGLEIENFLLQSNLCLLSDKTCTYLHPATDSRSSLDLAFCDPSLFLNYTWSVHSDLCGSDHYPTVLAKQTTRAVKDHRRWKISKADWEMFQSTCSNNLNPIALKNSSNTFEEFTGKLIEIANKSIPKTCGKLKSKQKPWFNEDCKAAISDRKSALKMFLSCPSQSNLENMRIMRAKARRTIKRAKRDSWRSYISKLNSNTPAKKVWDMVKRISGKSQPSAIHHLMVDNNRMEHPQDIANTLASTISVNSSNEHCTKNFQKIKTLQEKRPLKFLSDNSEAYNQLFSMTELQDALRQTTTPLLGLTKFIIKCLNTYQKSPLAHYWKFSITSGKQASFHLTGQKLS
jgi:hypothetical protein